jgi:hypothetical protein
LHAALMGDAALKAILLDARLTLKEPEDAEADLTAGDYSLHYVFTYLTRSNSLSTQP